MNVCRTCLSNKASKDICQLRQDLKSTKETDVMMFCLNVEVSADCKITTRLCTKCYKKILSFYQFKCMALKNDKFLRSIEPKTEENDSEDTCIKEEDMKYKSCEFYGKVKKEKPNDMDILGIKREPEVHEVDDIVESDDELLSVIKQHKLQNVLKDSKENVQHWIPLENDIEKKQSNEKSLQVCEECGKFVRNLKEHSRLHKSASERKRFECRNCNKTFANYSARYKHYKSKHLNEKYQCDICNKSVRSLNTHKLVMHNKEALRYACISCDRRFISQSALDIHTRSHTKDKPYPCELCQASFKTRNAKLTHKRQVHDQERSNLCQYCSKTFFKKCHLQAHIRSHTKEKPYHCEECSKMFQTSSSLSNHRLIHRGVKSHACSLCYMTFYTNGALVAHSIIHTKERRHSCQYCGMLFGRSDHRRRHEQTAHLRHIATLPKTQTPPHV